MIFPRIFPVTAHTDHVGQGTVFVVIQGVKQDGIVYVPQALAQGARTIVVQREYSIPEVIQQSIEHYDARVLRVDSPRRALAELSAHALGSPAQKLKIIAVTGTVGKTSSTYIIEHILKVAGYRTALLNSVENKIGDQVFPAQLTTALPDYLHVFFDLCVQHGIEYVVMETAAQAATLDRIYGLSFESVLFTNFFPEHLEFYAHMQDYFEAKHAIVKHCKDEQNVFVNAAYRECFDPSVRERYSWYSLYESNGSHVHTSSSLISKMGSSFTMNFGSGDFVAFQTPLLGEFNLTNVIGAVAVCYKLGVPTFHLSTAVASFQKIPGRLERYTLPNGAQCCIDYASNPVSIRAVLTFLRQFTDSLIVVSGAGGDRDALKRPVMGSVIAELADLFIITTDNPRSEDPSIIAQQIVAGVPGHMQNVVMIELDRKNAITKAYALSGPSSIIVLLGKGPDEYQIISGVKTHFSEREIITSL